MERKRKEEKRTEDDSVNKLLDQSCMSLIHIDVVIYPLGILRNT